MQVLIGLTMVEKVKNNEENKKKQKRIKKVFKSIAVKQGAEPVTLVNFGDWAAQWDELEEAWYVIINFIIIFIFHLSIYYSII